MILIKTVLFWGLFILVFQMVQRCLEESHERNSWLGKMKRKQAEQREQPNMRTCPTCGARTSASPLAAPAPPPIAPQGSTRPAPLHPQH